MIYTPSRETPQLVGTENERFFREKFRLFYDPAKIGFSGDAPKQGYDFENLASDVYLENVIWERNSVTVSGTFPAKRISALILGNPNFEKMSGFFFLNGVAVADFDRRNWITNRRERIVGNGSRIVFFPSGTGKGEGIEVRRRLAPGEDSPDLTDQNIFVLMTGGFEADSFALTFTGSQPVSLNKLYVGGTTEWIVGENCGYPLSGNRSGGLTDMGTVYGSRRPSVRGFGYSWSVIDDSHRRSMERYMDAVQNYKAHFIMPFDRDGDFIPPMFVRLASREAKNEKWRGGWFWTSPSLNWEVLR